MHSRFLYLTMSGKTYLICGQTNRKYWYKLCTFYNQSQPARTCKLVCNLAFMILLPTDTMPKRTYQPKKRQRSKEHGFMKRMATKAGRKVLKNRRQKDRSRLSH